MRVALAALTAVAGHADANLTRLRDALRAAARDDVDLVVAPEAHGQGLAALTDDPPADLAMGWAVDGEEIRRVRGWAQECGVAVCLPFYERSDLGLHSSAVVVASSGAVVAHHRRISAGWRDRRSTSPVYVDGASPVRFELHGLTCTIALCGDLWDHPELWADVPADVVLWPLWRDLTEAEWADGEKEAYAAHVAALPGTVLLVNGDGDGAHGGATAFRDGCVVADLPMTGPGVLVVDLDATSARPVA